MLNLLAVIPARFNSSRFPGKPLELINGKPMISIVYWRAIDSGFFSRVIVATDDDRIKLYCENNNIDVEMTSKKHINGTERVAEVLSKTKFDWVFTLQGDEPFFDYSVLNELINTKITMPDYNCFVAYTRIKNPLDMVNINVAKCVVNGLSEIVYITRSMIPYPKEEINYDVYKPLGQYIFSRELLLNYVNYDPGSLEMIEGLELLRLIENKHEIKGVFVESNSFSIDTPNDLKRLEEIKYDV
jgi:3-deoxy-manno-octulosonate cytidylyltransferase (CMP-KDO synthetase)